MMASRQKEKEQLIKDKIYISRAHGISPTRPHLLITH
jgi:hypothetical protein